ncbi:MAG: acetyltransferase, family [Rhodospirillales bacterium]|jgi:ribosomal protein S18 acetylase RimI-like enzyme|nr:acetyltransferase, family [Rhodospirillales bacterium]
MSVLIRPAGPADAEDIARVQYLSWRSTYDGLLTPRSLARVGSMWGAAHWRATLERVDDVVVPLVVETQHHGIVGFATCGRQRGRLPFYAGEIYTLYLLPTAQGRGYGTQLMVSMARVMMARDLRSAMVWALSTNHVARRFYERLGGRPIGDRTGRLFGERVPEAAYGWPDLAVLAWMQPQK